MAATCDTIITKLTDPRLPPIPKQYGAFEIPFKMSKLVIAFFLKKKKPHLVLSLGIQTHLLGNPNTTQKKVLKLVGNFWKQKKNENISPHGRTLKFEIYNITGYQMG